MAKIGIITFNDALNYGAFLQEYALQKFLKKYAIQVDVINYCNSNFEQLYKYANNPFMRKGIKNKLKIIFNMIFRPKTYCARIKKRKKFLHCYGDEIILSKEFEIHKDEIVDSYDYFIAGSDQVWNVKMTCYNLYYLLDFVTDKKKKLSYAASFGRTEFDDVDYELFKKYIGDFNNILVREKSGYELLKNNCGLNSKVVLDPTFLLNEKEWVEFSKKACGKSINKKYILIYIVSLPTHLYKAAIKFAEERKLGIVLLGRNSDLVFDGKRLKASVDVGPYEFMNYIINSEAIFTTSFHGTILSINLKKPFFYELSREKYNNNARLVDIIQMLELQDREITSPQVNDSVISWKCVHHKLNVERNYSKKLLLDSIGIII